MADNIPTQRKSTLAEAQSLGIDTSGMSTREAKAAIKDTREAQSDMADFINKVLDARLPVAAEAVAPAVAKTRTVEDPASTLLRGGGGNGAPSGNGVPVEFYT
jgi:hypothetical protein